MSAIRIRLLALSSLLCTMALAGNVLAAVATDQSCAGGFEGVGSFATCDGGALVADAAGGDAARAPAATAPQPGVTVPQASPRASERPCDWDPEPEPGPQAAAF